MMKNDELWFLVAVLCAGYVFIGIGVIGMAWHTENWILISLAVDAWLLNCAMLAYAKGKEW